MDAADPRADLAARSHPEAKLRQEIKALQRRVRRLEQSNPGVQAGVGAPSGTPREGTLYVRTDVPHLHYFAGGAWQQL